MKAYDKLVRDRIPEIIAARGQEARFRPCADDAEYLERLVAKLREEADELARDRNAAELADVLEVVRALAAHLGLDLAEAEAVRAAKAAERGGFDRRLILEEAE